MSYTKQEYKNYMRCARAAWLAKNNPVEHPASASQQMHVVEGVEVGKLARGYFDGAVDATVSGPDGKPDIAAMIAQTACYLAEGRDVICEAAFACDGNYCAVDILRREGDG